MTGFVRRVKASTIDILVVSACNVLHYYCQVSCVVSRHQALNGDTWFEGKCSGQSLQEVATIFGCSHTCGSPMPKALCPVNLKAVTSAKRDDPRYGSAFSLQVFFSQAKETTDSVISHSYKEDCLHYQVTL